jgi:hypothetical protein
VVNKGKGVINCCGYTKAWAGSYGGTTGDFPVSNAGDNTKPFFGGDADAFMVSPGGGVQDAFLVRLDPSNSFQQLRYGSFLGGVGAEHANAIDVVSSTCVVVVGYTAYSTSPNNFPVTPGAFDTTWASGGDTQAFLTRLNWVNNRSPTLQLDYSTFLGGDAGVDMARCVVLDSSNAFIGGLTMATDFPTANPFQGTFGGAGGGGYRGDGFVSELTLPPITQ